MKRTLYLIILLFYMAGCKKEDAKIRIEATRISFENKTLSSISLFYNGEKYEAMDKIATTYGDKKVEVFDRDTKAILVDTVLNITGKMTYYIYQKDANTLPVILTELPPPPAEPADPLENVEPAPEGFMKLKIKHDLLTDLGIERVDVQVLATINSASTYELLSTIPNVTTTVSTDFVLIRRPVLNGVLQQRFKFRLINSVTKEPVRSGTGEIYTTDLVTLTRSQINAYLLSFYTYDISPDQSGVEHNGSFYEVGPDLLDQR